MSNGTNRIGTVLLGGIACMGATSAQLAAEPTIWSSLGYRLGEERTRTIGGQSMSEAVADVLETAAHYEYMNWNFGLHDDGPCLLAGALSPGQSAAFTYHLSAGQTYAFIGGADSSVQDLDLVIRDQETGLILLSDRSADDFPVLTFTPMFAGQYTIEVVNYSGSGEAFVSLAVLRQGAQGELVESGIDAAERFIEAADSIVQELGTAELVSTPGEWSVYGSVLGPRASTRAWGIDLDPGLHGFLTVGDSGVIDADLAVSREGMLIGSDATTGRSALVTHRVWDQGIYEIEYENYESYSSSFVITGILGL